MHGREYLFFGLYPLLVFGLFLTGGAPLAIAVLGGLVLAACILMWPLLGLVLTLISSILWVVGALRPPGLEFLGPAQILGALTLLSWIVWACKHRVGLTLAPHMLPLALYAVIVVCSPLLTPAPVDASIRGIEKHSMLFLTYFLVANLAITPRAIKLVVATVVLTLATASAIGIVEYFMPGVDFQLGEVLLGARVDSWSLESGPIKRVTGGIGDSTWFALTVISGLGLTYFWARTARTPLRRGLALGLILLSLISITLSYTRTAFAALAAAIAYLVWRRQLRLLPLAVLGVVVVVAAPLWLPEGFTERMFSLRYWREGSTPMRKEITRIGLHMFAERPVFGHGWEQFGAGFVERTNTEEGLEVARRDRTGEEPAHFYRAHNLLLDVGVMYGLAGIAPLLAVFVMLLLETRQIRESGSAEEAELATALTVCLIAYYVTGLGAHSQELKIFWILAGLVAGLRRTVVAVQASRAGTLRAAGAPMSGERPTTTPG